MIPPTRPSTWLILSLALASFCSQGCTTTLNVPKTPFAQNSREYQGVDSSFDGGQTSVSKQVYYAVRQAQAENGIVLQVIGDEIPARVLPLPPDTQAVYVSELLTQTGVLQKLEAVNATLFRYSTESIGGIPMEVKMAEDGHSVRPESDYALQPGDRLMVSKAPHPAMKVLVNAVLGL